LLTLQVSVC